MAWALLIGSAVVLISVVGVRLAGRLGVSGLLLYLGLGLAAGTVFPQISIEEPQVVTVLGYAALGLILAQGGLTTRLSQLRPVAWPAVTLASLGVVVSIVAVAVPLVLILGLSWQLAVLLGSVLAATDAAAVFSVMRRMRLSERLRTVLEAEAGFNDAPVVVLVSVVASGAWATSSPWQIPVIVLAGLLGGAIAGIAVGYGARWLLPRLALPAVGLYPIAALALIALAYGLAAVVHASGFLAVYLAAVIIGSTARLPHRRSITGFADGMSWIAEIGLFFMLGALADVSRLPQAMAAAVVAGVALVLLGRPLAAISSLLPFRWPRADIAFASFAGLRGAVPIVFAVIPLGAAVVGAELVFDATFIIVLVLLLVQTPLLPRLGRRLGVCLPAEAVELEVESAPLDGMRAVVLGVEVPAGSALIGTFVQELGLPDGAVVSLIVRSDAPLVPDANTRIREGDRLVVVTTEMARARAEERIRQVSQRGRLATWLDGD